MLVAANPAAEAPLDRADETPEAIEVRFNLSVDEQLDAALQPFRRNHIRQRLLYGLLALACGFGAFWLDSEPIRVASGAIAVFYGAVAIGHAHFTRQRIRPLIEATPDPGLTTVRLSSLGYESTDAVSRVWLVWEAFGHYRITPHMLVLHRGPYVLHLLPRRAFMDAGDWDRCIELIVKKVGREQPNANPGFPVVPSAATSSPDADG